jgi:hypothetical protein
MFIRRFNNEIIFHLFSLIFFDLIYFIVLMMLLLQRNDFWLGIASIVVFGSLHFRYFRSFCREIRWTYVTPHVVFPLLLTLIAFLTYAP